MENGSGPALASRPDDRDRPLSPRTVVRDRRATRARRAASDRRAARIELLIHASADFEFPLDALRNATRER